MLPRETYSCDVESSIVLLLGQAVAQGGDYLTVFLPVSELVVTFVRES